MSEENKTYIGDGVYLSNDGYHIILETERFGQAVEIYLDLGVYLLLRKNGDEFFQLKKVETNE